VGVKFVSSERAYVIALRRTKSKGEISTRKDVFVGARNQKLLNELHKDGGRILPIVEASAGLYTLDPTTGKPVAEARTRRPKAPAGPQAGPQLVVDKAPKSPRAPRVARRPGWGRGGIPPLGSTPPIDPPVVPGDARDGNHSTAPATMAPELIDNGEDPLLAELDD
jgi:hypothetical protein